MTDQDDEHLLVLRAQAGDAGAFEQLLIRLHGPLRAYLRGMVGPAMVDDVMQEVALRIFRQIQFLLEPRAFRAWVSRITSRVALAHLQRDKRWREFETDPGIIDRWPAPDTRDLAEFESDFFALVERVSPASRAVILLHYQQHLSLEETAAVLDIPLGTAKSRLAYGVATLRKSILEKAN